MRIKHVLSCLAVSAVFTSTLLADDPARFDLTGPKIDVRVTRGGTTLPIAQVPNLLGGDKIWVKADLPDTQSNHLLLIVAFLRGTTNEPPDEWFTEIDTWDKKSVEGTLITVPNDAQQAIMFVAPETGGDFKTLRSAVKGKPGLFIRADVDLNEASFEQQRIERYLAQMKTVPATDADAIKDHSTKLASTLSLKPDDKCLKLPVDQQVNCLTQSSAPVLLNDGHGKSIAEAVSSGPGSDFINTASLTQSAGGGLYSAYVGAVVDLVHIVSMLKTAQYQYIPAISFPQDATLNLKLNAPPSFHNPMTVIVIGLPAIQKAVPPPMHAADAKHITCLPQPKWTLQIAGAPLVFSTAYAHDLVLHLNRTGDAADIPLTPNAYEGGLTEAPEGQHKPIAALKFQQAGDGLKKAEVKDASPSDLTVTGTVRGYWGFDAFEGPTLTLQQNASKEWNAVGDTQLLAGQDNHLTLKSDGIACVEKIALSSDKGKDVEVAFTAPGSKPAAAPKGGKGTKDDKDNKDKKSDADKKEAKSAEAKKPAPAAKSADKDDPAAKNELALDVPLKTVEPGSYSLAIKQYGASDVQKVPLTAYNSGVDLGDIKIHKGDNETVLTGKDLSNVVSVQMGGQTFTPAGEGNSDTQIHLASKSGVTPEDGSDAVVKLKDGRTMTVNVSAEAARPGLKLVSMKAEPTKEDGTLPVTLGAKEDIALNSKLTFVVATEDAFPRTQTIEVATAGEALKTKLALADNTLVLQDEHTAVATLDPLKAFGQSAFGKLQMRPVAADGTTGEWTPLGVLVRAPAISSVDCSDKAAGMCTVTGKNLFLVQTFGNAKDFAKKTDTPTGFADSSIKVPAPTDGATLYLKLRDDAGNLASISLPTTPSAPQAPAAPTAPSTPQATSAPSAPSALEAPAAPEAPAPKATAAPTAPSAPQTPEVISPPPAPQPQ